MQRREFIKSSLAMAALTAPLSSVVTAQSSTQTARPTVFFTRSLTPAAVVMMFRRLQLELKGKVAVKVHSGEKGNQNFLKPEFLKPIIHEVKGTVVECNTAYDGARNHTDKHRQLIKEHGWTQYFNIDLMDAEGPDLMLALPNGKVLKRNYVGKNITRYQSMLVVSHFKGHPMAGYGGALKQLSIGCASTRGKALIHSGGTTGDQTKCWSHIASQAVFGDAMADAALSVIRRFPQQLAYINILCNLSVDCDCCAVAEDPCMKDIGIVASTDPVAIDQACIDLVTNSNDPGRHKFLERVTSRQGLRVLETAAEIGCGQRQYNLVSVDA